VRWSSPPRDNDIVNVKRTINTTTKFNLRQHRDISLSAGVMVSLTATLIIASSLQEFVSVAADVTMDTQQDTEIRRIITEHIGRCTCSVQSTTAACLRDGLHTLLLRPVSKPTLQIVPRPSLRPVVCSCLCRHVFFTPE